MFYTETDKSDIINKCLTVTDYTTRTIINLWFIPTPSFRITRLVDIILSCFTGFQLIACIVSLYSGSHSTRTSLQYIISPAHLPLTWPPNCTYHLTTAPITLLAIHLRLTYSRMMLIILDSATPDSRRSQHKPLIVLGPQWLICLLPLLIVLYWMTQRAVKVEVANQFSL